MTNKGLLFYTAHSEEASLIGIHQIRHLKLGEIFEYRAFKTENREKRSEVGISSPYFEEYKKASVSRVDRIKGKMTRVRSLYFILRDISSCWKAYIRPLYCMKNQLWYLQQFR